MITVVVSQQLPLPVSPARRSDPATSSDGARVASIRAGSQQYALLEAWYHADHDGLTDEQATHLSGLDISGARSPWKRCGELRAAGLLSLTGETRKSTAGSKQRVRRITQAGRVALGEQQWGRTA